MADGHHEEVVAIVSLGGDGTMLRAVAEAVAHDVPVLGVNLGHLGYLAEVEPSELQEALSRLVTCDYQLSERHLLCAEVLRGASQAVEQRYLALNEIVIERAESGHVIRGDVAIDGEFFLHYDADGLIISSATGSTAYNLSARGPIVAPEVECVIVTPISPHTLFDRSLVFGPHQTVEFSLLAGPGAAVMVDGAVTEVILPGDRVRVCQSSERAKLVRFKTIAFQKVLRRKFRLSDMYAEEGA